jgi:hypothetical protein
MFRVTIFEVVFFASVSLLAMPKLFAADTPFKKLRVGYPSHSASMYPVYVTKPSYLRNMGSTAS